MDAGQQNEEMLIVTFNQDQTCFSCGTEKGFKIFNTHPLKDTFKRGIITWCTYIIFRFRRWYRHSRDAFQMQHFSTRWRRSASEVSYE